jgi:hypothetical protein
MSLESFLEPTQSIREKIRQRRSQMLVHSYIYYVMDDNIVDDHKWQQWANQLRDLQNQHPEECQIGFYDEAFADWNGDTGAFLPLKDEWVVDKAEYIYDLVKNEK